MVLVSAGFHSLGHGLLAFSRNIFSTPSFYGAPSLSSTWFVVVIRSSDVSPAGGGFCQSKAYLDISCFGLCPPSPSLLAFFLLWVFDV